MTTDTAHSHYRGICHAYPGPDGEIVVDGHTVSPPLESWLRDRRREAIVDPEEFRPPCPACECPRNRRHDITAAYQEFDWPAGLTDDDRVWLRRQARLARESA